MQTSIGDLVKDRNNNFNLVRFIAASAVIYSHSFTILEGDRGYWLSTGILSQEIGSLAVNMFFIVSGFLIAKSWCEQPDLLRFATARLLRIFPALAALSFATVFIIGPIASTCLPDNYFADLNTWLYLPLTTTLIDDKAMLPGTFETGMQAGVVNAPLWTLKYEVLSYLLVAALGMVRLRMHRGALAVLIGIGAGFLAIQTLTDWRGEYALIDSLMRFWFCFFVGAGFYLLRNRVQLRFLTVLSLAALAMLVEDSPYAELAATLALGYGLLWVALVPQGAIRAFNRIGDYSYGLYIFAWPIQQLVAQTLPELTPHLHFLASYPVALLVAAFSWHLLEKPCLKHRVFVLALVHSALDRAGVTLALKHVDKHAHVAS